MRHPESKKRWQSLYAGLLSPEDEGRLARLLGAAAKRKDAISRVVAIQALQPLIAGLVVESRMETNHFDRTVIRRVTNRIFDALMDVTPS